MEVFDFNFDAVKESLISESLSDTHKGAYGSTLLLGGDYPCLLYTSDAADE